MTANDTDRGKRPDTFADVVRMLEADASLAATKRRDLVSALRSMARLLDRPPDQVPANSNWLRLRLRQVHPARHGISPKTLSNIRSAVLAALKHAGAGTTRRDWLPPLSPAWASLLEALPDRMDRYKLSRLFRWASGRGIDPDDLDDAAIGQFGAMLEAETLVKDPGKIVRQAVNLWNRSRSEIPGWPRTELARPLKDDRWTFPLETFPESFQADVDTWCARLALDDLFDDYAPVRPCRPATIEHRRKQLRMAASALVRSGMRIAEIRSLAVLVEVGNFRRALGWMREERCGGRTTEALFGLASGLKAIARHHVKVDTDHLDALRRICARLDRTADRTRPRNRDRLEQFEDPLNLARLLFLPATLAEKARATGFRPRRAALAMQTALAIEILLFCPMRVRNLAALDVERHLRWQSRGRQQALLISIPADEVKNAVPLHYELVGPSGDLAREYIGRARPFLARDPGTALFPKLDGSAKLPGDLSTQIHRSILRETGLAVNPHLFRSLAARIHMTLAAGDFGTIAHVLNDRIGTVMKSYANHEQTNSLRRYQDSVVQLRRSPLAGAASGIDERRDS